MSYQPQQPVPGPGGYPQGPGVPMPPAQPAYAPVAPAPPSGGGGGKGLRLAGLALLVIGVVAGVVLYVMSGSVRDETVKKFARAPVGCTTTLEFDKAGTFTLYLETKGTIGTLSGDCTATGDYDRADDTLPGVTLNLVGPDGGQVSLTGVTGVSYDTGTYVGEAIDDVEIAATGTYQLTVSSDATDVAIAIGGDPEGDSGTMKTAGIAVGAAGVVLGIVLLLLGARRKGGTATPAAPAWQGGAPVAPSYQGVPGVPGQVPPPQGVPGYQQPPVQQPPVQQPPMQQPPVAPAPPMAPPPAPPAPPAGGQGWGAPQG